MAPTSAPLEALSAEETDDLLPCCGAGVLPLSGGTYPHSVQLGTGEQSHKRDCFDRNTNVCFTVYDEPSPGTWESVVITGELEKLLEDASKMAFDTVGRNFGQRFATPGWRNS